MPNATPATLAWNGVGAGNRFDPLGADDGARHADHEHADDEYREDLTHEAPGLPEPLLQFVAREPRAGEEGYRGERPGHAEELAWQLDRHVVGAGYDTDGRSQQRQRNEPERHPGPSIEAPVHRPEALPGQRRDRDEQRDQHRAMERETFFALRRIVGREIEQQALDAVRPGERQRERDPCIEQQRHLERAEHQQAQEHGEQVPRGPVDPGAAGEAIVGGLRPRQVVAVEDRRHDEADADAEHQRQGDARQGEIVADGRAGVGDGQDVAGRREEQERDRRSDARALAVDAGEQRDDRARADREHAAGERGCRIGDALGGVAPQIARDRLLRHQRRQGSRDEERRNETQEHVCGKVSPEARHATTQHRLDPGQRIHVPTLRPGGAGILTSVNRAWPVPRPVRRPCSAAVASHGPAVPGEDHGGNQGNPIPWP